MKSSLILRIIVSLVSMSCISWGLLQTSVPMLEQRVNILDARMEAMSSVNDARREADVTSRLLTEGRISKIEARLDIMLYLLVGIALAAGTTLVDTGYRIATNSKRRRE